LQNFAVTTLFRSFVLSLPGPLLHSRRRSPHKLANIAVAIVALGCASAWGFDYARYQETDLDALLAQPRPRSGVDIDRGRPLQLKVTLVSYAESCQTTLLKKTMIVAGIPKDQVDALQVAGCIRVRSANGKELRLFIQDVVSAFLPREVPLGSPVTLFASDVFTSPEGPGLLVNEFSVQAGSAPAKADDAANGTSPPCGCGTTDFHPGVDMTNDRAGTPVQVVDDGVVVKVEENEQASVDAFDIGRCGRYVVVKHSYPNGHAVFTRYAQLGRIVGSNGRPIALGMRLKKSDQIGEIGSSKILHFELRPVAAGGMEQDAGWTAQYGADPTMEWSRYQPVDPQKFDPDTFAGKRGGGK
jgi:hypothetical protein